jgi:hypothetical protein
MSPSEFGRKVLIYLGTALLMLLPFAAAPLVAEGILRLRKPSGVVLLQPCVRWGDRLLHHAYIPRCASYMIVNRQRVLYSFNEDGLRDRPAKVFKDGAIHAYGDSVVKGLYMNATETIPAILERELKDETGWPVLNAGLRFSSFTNQYLLFRKIVDHYPPKAVILFVNGTDIIDERFFRTNAASVDENGVPTSFVNPDDGYWVDRLVSFFHLNFPRSRLANRLVYQIRYFDWGSQLPKFPPNRENLCGGLFRFANEVKKYDVPLIFVFLPHWPDAIGAYFYKMAPYDPAHLDIMKTCARETQGTVIDLTTVESELKPEYFIVDQIHYSRAGLDWLMPKMIPPIREALKSRLHLDSGGAKIKK